MAKLFATLGARYKDRQGGYTRVLKAGFRYGDAAPMAIIELVDRDPAAKGAGDKARVAAEEAAAERPEPGHSAATTPGRSGGDARCRTRPRTPAMGAIRRWRSAWPSASGRRMLTPSPSPAASTTGRRTASPLAAEDGGCWYGDVAEREGRRRVPLPDPRRRHGAVAHRSLRTAVTNSVGNGIVIDPARHRLADGFEAPPWHRLVIYEMHIGTFSQRRGDEPGTFEDAIGRLGHLDAPRRQRGADHAGGGVRRRRLLGLQPGAHLRRREHLRRPGGPCGLRRRRARRRHRRDPRRRLQSFRPVRPRPLAASTAGPRTTRAASTSTTTGAPRRPGATPAPTTAGPRCASSSATTRSTGSRSTGSTACAST